MPVSGYRITLSVERRSTYGTAGTAAMKHTTSTTSADTGTARSPAAVGTLTMVAGGLFALGALLSAAVEWAWIGVLIGFALLAYVLPHLHRSQAPADGWTGRIGALLGAAGAALLVTLGVIFLVWEAVGTPGEPTWAGVLWMVGFFAFLVGVVLFAIGSAVARRFPPGAPVLVLVGLVSAIGIDMATGAFFSDDGSITEWGFYIGVPLFGLGLAWMGYATRTGSALAHRSRVTGPTPG